jgi:hypothetical protein
MTTVVRTNREELRGALVARLGLRRAEIEEAVLACVREAVPADGGEEDPELASGLKDAIDAAVGYGLASIEHGGQWAGAVPLAAVAQARRAARGGVSLTSELRRYVVGHRRLSEFALEEIERANVSSEQRTETMLEVSGALSSLLDALQTAVADAYLRESARRTASREERRAELVRRLLAGAPITSRELGYELETEHLALHARGPGAEDAIATLSERLGRRLLRASSIGGTCWSWLAGHEQSSSKELERLLDGEAFAGVQLALGTRAPGVAGFRLTHRQAHAALQVSRASPRRVTRFSEVIPECLALQDNALAGSLIAVYLAPLSADEDDRKLRETLTAYFGAGRQMSAAAHALGIHRRTVEYRLAKIEGLLGRPLSSCLAEVELALRVEALHTAATEAVKRD